ncbi:hypothetical protein [Thiocystis violacea]|uniref:hypothetical protein n=1 Tax=Thiocystis violacea TaxID=13725 RepID=UPI001907D06F|nr:hypothetical protein [Thiocystis violacea]MBK1722773.1 hypothetical protein [Thiocystis violacea]
MVLDEVILHIGTGKTGSTSIQYFLLTNRERLLRNGYLAQIPEDFLASMKPEEIEWCSDAALELGLATLQSAVATSGATRLLWSWEALSNRAFSASLERVWRVKEALPANAYRVIVYLRRQDHWLRSAYLQWGMKDNLERGPTLPFEEWYSRLRAGRLRWWRAEDLDYRALLEPWIQVFGRDSLEVRVYERDQLSGRSAVADFREHSGLPKDPGYRVDIEEVNQTFCLELHELVAMYGEVVGGDAPPSPLLCYLDEAARDPFFQSPGFSRFAYSPRIARALLEDCEPSNAWVARELLGRDDGRLFHEPWPEVDDRETPNQRRTRETILPILTHLTMVEHQRTTYVLDRYREQQADLGQHRDALSELTGQLTALREELAATQARVHALSNRPTLSQRIRFRLTQPLRRLRAAMRARGV